MLYYLVALGYLKAWTIQSVAELALKPEFVAAIVVVIIAKQLPAMK